MSQSCVELWQAGDVKRATVGLSSCQPWAACAGKSLPPSSGHSERSLMGGLSQKAQLVPWAWEGFDSPELLSPSQGFFCPLPRGFSLPGCLVWLWS